MKKKKLFKGWLARDDDTFSEIVFFDTKPVKRDWYWVDRKGFLPDYYLEFEIPQDLDVKKNERKKCIITIEIVEDK